MSKTKSNNSWIILSVIVVPVPFILMIWVMSHFDFFVFTGDAASAKIVGTALTLGGGLVATMVTMIGLVLRHSTEKRNADLRDDAEKRLKLEAAIRAVDLLGTSEGKDSTETQRTGALFSLAHLGSIDLAVDLVHLMRPADLVGAQSTASLLNMALKSGKIKVQEQAANFLYDESPTLLTNNGYAWPNIFTEAWPLELSFQSRYCSLYGLIELILARPQKSWQIEYLNSAFITLAVAFRTEKDLRIKSSIGFFLIEFINTFNIDTPMCLTNENLNLVKFQRQIKDFSHATVFTSTLQQVNRLITWLEEKDE